MVMMVLSLKFIILLQHFSPHIEYQTPRHYSWKLVCINLITLLRLYPGEPSVFSSGNTRRASPKYFIRLSFLFPGNISTFLRPLPN
jgi:hypothetical protein